MIKDRRLPQTVEARYSVIARFHDLTVHIMMLENNAKQGVIAAINNLPNPFARNLRHEHL